MLSAPGSLYQAHVYVFANAEKILLKIYRSNLLEVSDSMIMYPCWQNLLYLVTGCHSICHSVSTTACCIKPEAVSNNLCSQWTEWITVSCAMLSRSGNNIQLLHEANELVISRELFSWNRHLQHAWHWELTVASWKCRVVQDHCGHHSWVTFLATMTDKPRCSFH